MRDPRLASMSAVPAATGSKKAPSPEKVRSTPPADSAAQAQGRRTLSTAFVRVGPDGHLTVELRDGSVLVLRDVTMRREDYCGVQVSGEGEGKRRCGGYAEVAAARPGGGPMPGIPDLASPNQAALGLAPPKR